MADHDSSTTRDAGQVSLADGPVTIGRSSRNSVVLSSSAVSREHCTITREHGRVLLRDLGSKHGTKVNGSKVTETPLLDGDVIRIGRFELTFVATECAADPDESSDLDLHDTPMPGSDESATGASADLVQDDTPAEGQAPPLASHVKALEDRLDRDLALVARERKALTRRIARLKELRKQLEIRSTAVAEKEHAAANENERIEKESAVIRERQEDLARREVAVARRGREVEEATSKLEADETDVARREEAIESLQQEVESERNVVLGMSRELRAREVESRERRTKLEAAEKQYQQEMQAFETRKRQSTENLEGLADQLEEAFAEAAMAREHAEQHESQLMTLHHQIDVEREKWARERRGFEQRMLALQARSESIDQVERSLAEERERRGALQTALEQQQHEHESALEQWNALRERLEAEIQSRRQRMEDLSDSDKSILAESERREAAERALQEQRAEFERAMQLAARDKQELLAVVTSLRARLKGRPEPAGDALASIEGSARQLREASRRLREVQGRLRQFENQWIETDELVDEVADPRALDQLIQRREALAAQLESAHSSRDALLAELQNIAERFGRPVVGRS